MEFFPVTYFINIFCSGCCCSMLFFVWPAVDAVEISNFYVVSSINGFYAWFEKNGFDAMFRLNIPRKKIIYNRIWTQ